MKTVCSKKLEKNTQTGFTIMEVLVVVIVLGAMAGALMKIIDVGRQRDYAKDGVLRQNLSDLAATLETYRVAEGSYPTDSDNNYNPLDDAGAGSLGQYLDEWPSSDFKYVWVNPDFVIYVDSQVNPGTHFKYTSVWKTIKECEGGNKESASACGSIMNPFQ